MQHDKAQQNKEQSTNTPPATPPPLVEGVDFYMEGPYLVFTEVYHQKRGFCCKSGCRHCPYRKKKT